MMLPWQFKQRLPERVTLGSWLALEGFIALGVFAQWYLFFAANARGVRLLLPALAGIAVPLALVPAAIIASRLGTPVEARTVMLRLALLSMITLAPVLGWWMPNANQEWRVVQVQSQEPPSRGARELTVNDLLRSHPPGDLSLPRTANWTTVRRDAALERLSVWFMPLTMTVVGLTIAYVTRMRPTMLALGSWMVAGLTWLTLLDLSPWLAHLALLLGAKTLHASGRRSAALVH